VSDVKSSGSDTVRHVTDSVCSSNPAIRQQTLQSIRRLLLILVVIAIAATLVYAQRIVMPVVLGLMIALTLRPPVQWLVKLKLPAPLAAVIVVFSVSGVVGVGGYVLTEPLVEVFVSIPDIGDRIQERLKPYPSSLEAVSQDMGGLGVGVQAAERGVMERPDVVETAAASIAAALTSFSLAAVLALLILASG